MKHYAHRLLCWNLSYKSRHFSNPPFRLVACMLFLSGWLSAQSPFVTTWKTDNPGMSEDNQIQIPGLGTNYNISWEEVGNTSNNGSTTGSGTTTITFPSAGTYSVSITPGSGTFTAIRFDLSGERQKILSVDQWGDVVWSTLNGAFNGCFFLDCNALDVPNLSHVTSLEKMFMDCWNLNGPANMGDWDIENVTNLSRMFQDATIFNQDIGNWNVENVTSISNMFRGATNFNQNIGNWNTKNIQFMSSVFRDASAFNQDIGNWNTEKVTTMFGMFERANSFNQDIGNWNTSNVTLMREMFYFNDAFNQDISRWDVSNVQNFNQMFWFASSFNQDLGSWELGTDVSMFGMLSHSGIDCENYSSILIGWSDNPNTPDNIVLSAENLEYGNDAAEARNFLVTTKGWEIRDDKLIDEFCLNPTSVHQPEGTTTITIWPNPVSDRIYVDVLQNRILTVYDLAGRSHLKVQISAGESQVPVGHLAPGMYLFHFGEGAWHKVVVQ